MERAEWLKQLRSMAEAIYDYYSPEYWVNFGFYENQAHQEYLQKFLSRIGRGGAILSAACGAGRYDGMLLNAGHSVVGIDQSEGMLKRAREHLLQEHLLQEHLPREHFPEARYEKMGLQEMDFHEEFDGAVCIDAMEHICPEDWPVIMKGFGKALKPGGVLYFTMEVPDTAEVETSFERAQAQGLPVVFGEVADEVESTYKHVMALKSQGLPRDLADLAVYHYYPLLEQARAWIEQAGLAIEEEGVGSGYRHVIARKKI